MKTYCVKSGEWSDKVSVDCSIFTTYESQCQEAITLSLGKWVSHGSECKISEFAVAYATKTGSSDDDWGMCSEYVFENLGRQDIATELRLFYK